MNQIVIAVERFMHRIIYHKLEVEPSGKVIGDISYCCRTDVFEHQGKKKIFIGDRNDVLRYEPFIYINERRSGLQPKSRLQMASAIQRYYTFCDIYGYNPKDISEYGLEMYIIFMLGTDLVSYRDNSPVAGLCIDTVKNELSMVRKFVQKMKFNDDAFGDPDLNAFSKRVFKHDNKKGPSRPSITASLRSDSLKKLKAPKHFTPFEAKVIVDKILTKKDWGTFLLFRLGYGYGLRRGENLGLTREDLVSEYDSDQKRRVYQIIIWNRVTDNDDQHAKTLRHPSSVAHYKSKDFEKSQSIIEISESLYNDLVAYDERSRDYKKLGPGRFRALVEATKADSRSDNRTENHYIFFNYWRGKFFRLSGQTLNNRLKLYFDQAGVKLTNVSHALRHSFAMFHAHYSTHKMELEELRVLMRHASSSSTEKYYNLTEKEQNDIRSQYSLEMAEIIPEFK